MLVWRWNVTWYPKLNITLLFDILETLNDDDYDHLIRDSFSRSRYGFADRDMWSINDLTSDLNKAIDDGEIDREESLINLMQLLIYFFPIWTRNSYSLTPAFETFKKFSVVYTEPAFDLLRPRSNIQCLSVRAQIWRMFVYLDNYDVPYELVEEAVMHVLSLENGENEKKITWIYEVVWFLEKYALDRELWWIDQPLLSRMSQFSRRHYLYETNENN